MTVTSSALRPFIEACGYTGDRLAEGYSFGPGTVELGGFIGKPWDARSACLAVVDATTDGRRAAQRCIDVGAPTALVCRGDALEWWRLSLTGPHQPVAVRASEVEGFFRTHKAQFKPENIYDAKLRRPTPAGVQMEFVDAGLMPALERRAGEALDRLVTQTTRVMLDDLGPKVRTAEHVQGVYKTVFWLLAAKLLKDKGVRGFKSLDLCDTRRVFAVVGEHYRDAKDYPPGGRAWRSAIERAAGVFAGFGKLGHISAESLAYLYEASMIDGPVRKTLGIHSTPSVLVDHMLSQVWPLVVGGNPGDQRVFEPACGHGAFLTAAMRDVRNWSGMDDGAARHRFLRGRLRGVEMDPFAVEIAKLSLTLADVPHGNTWDIRAGDMFAPGVLAESTQWASVVLSNPPYEAFNKTGAKRYEGTGEPVTAQTKAAEMLGRVVDNLQPGAAFGFVLPQGALYDEEAAAIRARMLETCEIAEIGLFEDKLFSGADHEACILIGRRKGAKTRLKTTMYRRVRNADIDAFRESLRFSREEKIEAGELGQGAGASLYEPDLRGVWAFLSKAPRLGEAFDAQKGFELRAKAASGHRQIVRSTPSKGYTKAVLKASDEYAVWALPREQYVDLRPANVRRPGAASVLGEPQVVLNYAGPRSPWRFRPVVDSQGVAVSSRFVVFRPASDSKHTLTTLWAVLLSPIANAYAYSWSGKRQTLVREWLAMPLPEPTETQRDAIEAAAAAYLERAVPPEAFTLAPPDEAGIRAALLDLDASVLDLYALPRDLERELLAIFDGVARPGVGCAFTGYPPGFTRRGEAPTYELPDDDRPIWERIAELGAMLPEEAIVDIPTDGASQLDHYLYGAPKRTR